jgi:hypothetical protein
MSDPFTAVTRTDAVLATTTPTTADAVERARALVLRRAADSADQILILAELGIEES